MTTDKLRIIVVLRADLLQMTRGKGEVQFGHAVASCLVQAMQQQPELVARYLVENQTKIAMEVDTLDALMRIREKAEKRGVNYALITDAAHTCFNEPTITCIGLGPMTKTDGNTLTRDALMRP